jgi:hypothetical protein
MNTLDIRFIQAPRRFWLVPTRRRQCHFARAERCDPGGAKILAHNPANRCKHGRLSNEVNKKFAVDICLSVETRVALEVSFSADDERAGSSSERASLKKKSEPGKADWRLPRTAESVQRLFPA